MWNRYISQKERVQDQHRLLWARLQSFPLDDPEAAAPFSARLAREHDWTMAEAARVIGEYRRFLFLAAAAGHPVSPSAAVDHAWHLHLLYTKSYWLDLCRDLLGFDLHHEPSRGGHDESSRFGDWYVRTLDSYRRLFGEDPPQDLWPPPGRQHGSGQARWIDPQLFWLVPKSLLPFRRKPGL